MDRLLADEPLPILEGLALLGVGVGLLLGSLARVRSIRSPSRLGRLFWSDMRHAAWVWSSATMALLVGTLAQVEGIRTPIWLIVALGTGAVGLVLARSRWPRVSAVRASSGDRSSREQRTIVSTSWELACLGAAGGAFLLYILAASHGWGHPIHWVIALVGGGLGYAISLTIVSPRYVVRTRTT